MNARWSSLWGAVWPAVAWQGAGILQQLVQAPISRAWLQVVQVFSLMMIIASSLVAANEPVANKTSEANYISFGMLLSAYTPCTPTIPPWLAIRQISVAASQSVRTLSVIALSFLGMPWRRPEA